MAKRFMFVCLGLLCLVFAYHLGAGSAQAQSGSAGRIQLITASGDDAWVVTGTVPRCRIQRKVWLVAARAQAR